jgi:hypothetical protein
VPREHAGRAGAERDRRRHVGSRPHRDHLGPHEARDPHPTRGGEHGEDRREPGLPERHAHEQQHQARQGQQQVGERRDGAVDESAPPSGHGAERRAEHPRDAGARDAHEQREPAGEHHPHEQVAAEPVGAEQVKHTAAVAAEGGNEPPREHLLDAQRVAARQRRHEDHPRRQRQERRCGEGTRVAQGAREL